MSARMLDDALRTTMSMEDENDSEENRPFADVSVSDAWDRIEAATQKLMGEQAQFASGSDDESIDILEQELDVEVPDTLRESLKRHNGVEFDQLYLGDPYQYVDMAVEGDLKDGLIGAIHDAVSDEEKFARINKKIRKTLRQEKLAPGLFQQAIVLSVEEIQKKHAQMRKIATNGDIDWKATWIPFATHGHQSHFYIDTESDGSAIYSLSPKDNHEDAAWMIHDYAQWLGWCAFAAELVVDIFQKYDESSQESFDASSEVDDYEQEDEAFENCVAQGGEVRRVSGPNKKHGLKDGEYVNYCILDNKTYRGEVKTKKEYKESNQESKTKPEKTP